MSDIKPIDIALAGYEKRMYYIKNHKDVAEKIKHFITTGYDKDAKVIVFGSAIRGNYHALSDLDILIVSDRLNMDDTPSIISELKNEVFNDPFIPIEFHFADGRLFNGWYKRFIDVYEIH
ncbi:MAG: nucleotidyltransferase domain-containing protein [Candidatus Nitrosocaldus sp.]